MRRSTITTKIQPTSISVLSSLRRSKIDQAAKSLEDVRASLPRGALKQEVEAALRIMQSPEWKVPQNALATSLGQLRDVLSKTSAYQEVKAELQRSFTALKSLHEHVFEEGIDHGVLANHEWLVHMRTHHPALFDRVIEAADEGHIHIRHVGLNDPDIAGEVLDWRRHPETMIQKIRGAPVAAATPVPKANGRTTSGTSSLPHTAEELAAPEIDAARLGRACPAELPAAEAAIRDLKKLGIITAIVGAAVAAAAILSHRHARDRTEAMTPRAAWQVRTQQNHADSKSPSL